jgi:hypothetical protein
MDGRTRFYILMAVIICAIALFLGTRDSDNKKEIKSEPKQAQPTKKAYDYEDASLIDEDQGGVSQEELQQTKELAIQFTKSYHDFDATQPLQNIENSKNFMSEDYYKYLIQHPSRGTLETVKQKWVSVTDAGAPSTSKTNVVWSLVVHSQNTDNDGKVWERDDWYYIQIKKVNEQYKVTGVNVNAPF